MDVRCERCSTEYEFDDALVSGRGTTVKCTNCGHKFKIRRQDGDFSEDFWNVTTGDGRTLVFTSLRELQRAIQTHLVDRHDELSRGGLPPKPIGQIPELMPFFDQREREKKSLPPPPEGPASLRSSRPPPPPGAAGNVLAEPPRKRQSTRPDFPPPTPAPADAASSMKRTLIGGTMASPDPHPPPPPMRRRMSSVPPPLPASARPPPREPEPAPDPSPSSRETPRVNEIAEAVPPSSMPTVVAASPIAAVAHEAASPVSAPPILEAPDETPGPRPPFEASSPLPAPTAPVLRKMLVDVEDVHVRGPSPSLPDAPASMGRRRSVGGFIVVTVLLLGVGLLAAVWARDHLAPTLGGSKPQPPAAVDPRVATHLSAGDKALADGDLDLARDSFVKASALAERDPRVLLATARLAAARADVPWLKARLLPDEAREEQQRVREGLGELAAAAKRAADDALAAAPDDVSALRAKIDALRIVGDRDGARALVSRIASTSPQGESAYVLAALDLAEAQPLWSTVVERLRVAAGAEMGPGRARAALVYALARSGDVAAARVELGRLEGMSRRSELTSYLKSFVDRQASAAGPAAVSDAGAGGDASAATVGAGAGGKPEPRPGVDHGSLPTDPRVLVARGEEARQKGDLDRAQVMFSAALEKNGADTEALSGLAAVAYARRDLPGAKASYKRVLALNPSYVPALVGVADCDWESGDRASATRTYKEIVDRFPEGTYPGRVKMRAEPSAPAPTPAPAPAPTPAPAPAPAPTPTTESP